MGLSNGVVAIPRFWTELSLIRETSAPESSSASIMPPSCVSDTPVIAEWMTRSGTPSH